MPVHESQAPKWKALKDMKRPELERELEEYRKLWEYTPPEVRDFLGKLGKIVRAVPRNYQGKEGQLLSGKFELTEITLGVVEPVFSQRHGKKFLETKTVEMPISQLNWFEVLEQSEEMEEPRIEAVTAPPVINERVKSELENIVGDLKG